MAQVQGITCASLLVCESIMSVLWSSLCIQFCLGWSLLQMTRCCAWLQGTQLQSREKATYFEHAEAHISILWPPRSAAPRYCCCTGANPPLTLVVTRYYHQASFTLFFPKLAEPIACPLTFLATCRILKKQTDESALRIFTLIPPLMIQFLTSFLSQLSASDSGDSRRGAGS